MGDVLAGNCRAARIGLRSAKIVSKLRARVAFRARVRLVSSFDGLGMKTKMTTMRSAAVIGLVVAAGLVLAWAFMRDRQEPPVAVSPLPHTQPAPAPEKQIASASEPTPALVPEAAPVKPAENAESKTAESPPVTPPVSEPSSRPPEEQAADDESADDAAAEENDEAPDDTANPAAIDVDHAADLFADWIAREDAAASESAAAGGDAPIDPGQQAWKTFDKEDTDPQWSQASAQQIEATLDQWLAALPDEVKEHIDVVHVECRLTLCQILAADNDNATQSERAQSGQEWQQAIATLPQQPWWQEFGFVDLVTMVTGNEEDGYTLYQTYLRRDVKPPESG